MLRRGLDNLLCKFEYVQRSTKSGFSIRNYRNKPINLFVSLGSVNLNRALECMVDSSYQRGNAVGRVETIDLGKYFRIGLRQPLPAIRCSRLP